MSARHLPGAAHAQNDGVSVVVVPCFRFSRVVFMLLGSCWDLP
jgi:hypothetical protein